MNSFILLNLLHTFIYKRRLSSIMKNKSMDSPKHKSKSHTSNNVFFFFIILFTNLITFFISSSFSSCSYEPISTTTDESTFAESDLPPEFVAFTSGHALPFGYSPNFDSDTIYPPVGKACTLFPNELRRYMSYKVNGSCPDDELPAQKLLLKGCEPLPRRRCRPASQPVYTEPHPFPESQWTTPHDSSVVWTAYSCKNYSCLVNRKRNEKGFTDCKDCFDLQGNEASRWASPVGGGLHFSIDEVLATKKRGSIRIGLDIGGGVATFAVRMRERNITIITTSINLNGPFNNFIASRGVIPLYMTISQRLPLFDNTLDIVHSMHVLSNWIPTTLLHFILYDVYRVLRPGGLFWLDHFFCLVEEFEVTYKPLIESIGFRKLRWVVGKKLDRGPERREMYLSALLEKPLNNSW